jgi:hypothetical protein
MTIPSLNSVTVLQGNTTGFNYPSNAQVVAILGDGTTPGGNAVLQQSALGFRQCVIAFDAEASDVALHRALYESKALVTYVDEDGAMWGVRVLEFEASLSGNAIWACTATLLETDVVEGS